MATGPGTVPQLRHRRRRRHAPARGRGALQRVRRLRHRLVADEEQGQPVRCRHGPDLGRPRVPLPPRHGVGHHGHRDAHRRVRPHLRRGDLRPLGERAARHLLRQHARRGLDGHLRQFTFHASTAELHLRVPARRLRLRALHEPRRLHRPGRGHPHLPGAGGRRRRHRPGTGLVHLLRRPRRTDGPGQRDGHGRRADRGARGVGRGHRRDRGRQLPGQPRRDAGGHRERRHDDLHRRHGGTRHDLPVHGRGRRRRRQLVGSRATRRR